MNKSVSLPNGLPIPYGQIFILTNPAHGLTAKHIVLMEFIYSMAGQYDKPYLVNAMPIDCPELYDCVACKVKTDDGDVVLISDKKSLVEMLSEFWGLDYDEVCKTIRISAKKNKAFVIGGESHPIRMTVKPIERVPEMGYESNGILLQALQSHTKEGALRDIRSILQDNFNQKLGISALDLVKIFDEEQNRERSTWHLDIKIGKGRTGYNKDFKIVDKVKCEIFLVDPSGAPHQLDIKAQNLALYLTFILFKDGIKLSEIQNDEFFTIFKTMCERLPYINEIPEDGKTLKKYAGDKRNQILRKITNIIKDDQYLIKQFAIEGYTGEPYKVAASTDEHREAIKNAFGIE